MPRDLRELRRELNGVRAPPAPAAEPKVVGRPPTTATPAEPARAPFSLPLAEEPASEPKPPELTQRKGRPAEASEMPAAPSAEEAAPARDSAEPIGTGDIVSDGLESKSGTVIDELPLPPNIPKPAEPPGSRLKMDDRSFDDAVDDEMRTIPLDTSSLGAAPAPSPADSPPPAYLRTPPEPVYASVPPRPPLAPTLVASPRALPPSPIPPRAVPPAPTYKGPEAGVDTVVLTARKPNRLFENTNPLDPDHYYGLGYRHLTKDARTAFTGAAHHFDVALSNIAGIKEGKCTAALRVKGKPVATVQLRPDAPATINHGNITVAVSYEGKNKDNYSFRFAINAPKSELKKVADSVSGPVGRVLKYVWKNHPDETVTLAASLASAATIAIAAVHGLISVITVSQSLVIASVVAFAGMYVAGITLSERYFPSKPDKPKGSAPLTDKDLGGRA